MSMSPHWVRLGIAIGVVAANLVPLSLSHRSAIAQETSGKKYSPEVVAKAEQVLAEAGLRRSGRSIQSSETSEIARAITNLARDKRALRLVQQEWQSVVNKIAMTKQELRALNAQELDLNLKLARVAQTDVKTSNQIAALLSASRARMRELIEQREQLKADLLIKRGKLSDAESEYADTVLAIRKDVSALQEKIELALNEDKVRIALKVMATNYQTAPSVSASKVLSSLDKRVARIEQEIFSESIDLQSQGGALYAEVTVGKKTTRMVVDSGASLVTLPSSTAAELGIRVPLGARVIKLMLADGTAINAHGVVLPRVRIGEFEAENVEAAVLDGAAVQAEPLLGMSYLGNFKFEVDAANKSLKLLRVASE